MGLLARGRRGEPLADPSVVARVERRRCDGRDVHLLRGVDGGGRGGGAGNARGGFPGGPARRATKARCASVRWYI